LNLLAATSFLSLPIVAVNFWIYSKGTNKIFAVSQLQKVLIPTLIVAILAFVLIRKASWLGFLLTAGFTTFVVSSNIYFLLLTKNYALAFYALFVAISSIFFHISVYKLLKAAYLNPGLRWFEGKPRFIPRLNAYLSFDGAAPFQVRFTKLANDGCFVYSVAEQFRKNKGRGVLQLELEGVTTQSQVDLISVVDRGKGMGLRFVENSFDSNKEILDLIDSVRSAGYVS